MERPRDDICEYIDGKYAIYYHPPKVEMIIAINRSHLVSNYSSAVSWREYVTFRIEDDDVRFVLGKTLS